MDTAQVGGRRRWGTSFCIFRRQFAGFVKKVAQKDAAIFNTETCLCEDEEQLRVTSGLFIASAQ